MFDECGLKILDGHEVFYYRHDKNGDLDGMISSHMDNFILADSDAFLEEIMWKIAEKLEISKLEDDEFRFTGMDVKKEDYVIVVKYEGLCKEFGEDRDKKRNAR